MAPLPSVYRQGQASITMAKMRHDEDTRGPFFKKKDTRGQGTDHGIPSQRTDGGGSWASSIHCVSKDARDLPPHRCCMHDPLRHLLSLSAPHTRARVERDPWPEVMMPATTTAAAGRK
jgi:hypothetical protein